MEKLKEQILANLKTFGHEAGAIDLKKAIKLDNVEVDKTTKLIHDVVQEVEAVSERTKALNGEDKLDLACQVLNGLIDIPYVPESVEGMIIKFVVSYTVKQFNLIKGKLWGKKDG